MKKIEQFLSNTEDTLSKWSAIPIIGSVSATVKLFIGTNQAVIALALLVFASVPARLINKDWSLSDHCLTHMKHGIGNIVAGVFEFIPGVQTVVYITRIKRKKNDHMNFGKFMPYSSTKSPNLPIQPSPLKEQNRLLKATSTEENLEDRHFKQALEQGLSKHIFNSTKPKQVRRVIHSPKHVSPTIAEKGAILHLLFSDLDKHTQAVLNSSNDRGLRTETQNVSWKTLSPQFTFSKEGQAVLDKRALAIHGSSDTGSDSEADFD